MSTPRSAAPVWAKQILVAGGSIVESGEHGQWTIVYGDWYVTDADCADGILAVGPVTGPDEDPFYGDPDELPILDALAMALG